MINKSVLYACPDSNNLLANVKQDYKIKYIRRQLNISLIFRGKLRRVSLKCAQVRFIMYIIPDSENIM